MKLDAYLTTTNISTQQFADLLRVQYSTIWRLRHGARRRVTRPLLRAIMVATGGKVGPSDFDLPDNYFDQGKVNGKANGKKERAEKRAKEIGAVGSRRRA